jgi:hypothetical protein
MRYVGLLFALSLIATPALARKHQKHVQHASAQRAPAPPPAVVAEPAPPPPVEARRDTQVAQADDEEVPGKRHRK